MDHDHELLRRFADEGAQDAFAEFVQRKAGLVYAAALRQTGGDAHLAQDVTQAVFAVLAARAGALASHAVLAGWLFTTTRFLAIRAVRRQRRWQRREHEANARGELSEPFAEVFQLSAAERQTLQRALDHARDRLAALLRENATVTPEEAKEALAVRIDVKPFPQAGGAVYDELMKAFASVLEEERNAAFITLAADRLDNAFAHFGAEQRSVTFFYNEKIMNGPDLAASWVRIGDESTNVSGDFRTRQEIERQLGPIARLLPADFGRDR